VSGSEVQFSFSLLTVEMVPADQLENDSFSLYEEHKGLVSQKSHDHLHSKESFTLKTKQTFADNLLTPMSSKMSTSFFLQSKRN